MAPQESDEVSFLFPPHQSPTVTASPQGEANVILMSPILTTSPQRDANVILTFHHIDNRKDIYFYLPFNISATTKP